MSVLEFDKEMEAVQKMRDDADKRLNALYTKHLIHIMSTGEIIAGIDRGPFTTPRDAVLDYEMIQEKTRLRNACKKTMFRFK